MFSVAGTVALMGGSISWSLSDDFESNRIVTFLMRTTWDLSTFYQSSITLNVGQPVQFPSNTDGELTPAGRLVSSPKVSACDGSQLAPNSFPARSFGVLKIMVNQSVYLDPNAYVVRYFDVDISTNMTSTVDGELAFNVTLPVGVYSANASIVQASGLPLTRQGTVIGAGTTQYISGGMSPCNQVGACACTCARVRVHEIPRHPKESNLTILNTLADWSPHNHISGGGGDKAFRV